MGVTAGGRVGGQKVGEDGGVALSGEWGGGGRRGYARGSEEKGVQ